MAPKHLKGQQSEETVCAFLEKQNWKIIERRKRTRYAEVDILARDDGDRLSIVEVKSVTTTDYSEIVSRRQLQRLERAAQTLRFSLRGEQVPALIYLAAVNQQNEVDLILLDVVASSMSN